MVVQHPANTDALIDLAADVIGDRETALGWMGTPVQALDYATPVSLLNSKDGFDRVAAVLEQIQNGVLDPSPGSLRAGIRRTAEKAQPCTEARGIPPAWRPFMLRPPF